MENDFKAWLELQKKDIFKNKDEFLEFRNIFFLRDQIDINSFYNNYLYLQNSPWIEFNEEYITNTIEDSEVTFYKIIFNEYFIAGYPDVVLWYKNNFNRINLPFLKTMKSLPNELRIDYLKERAKSKDLYKSLIKYYKKEGYKLECKIIKTPKNYKLLKIGKPIFIVGLSIGIILLIFGSIEFTMFFMNTVFWIGGFIWLLDININKD